METTPPAWLRSYKAQSAIIPNFASQVRTELDGKSAKKASPQPLQSEKEDHEKAKYSDSDTAVTHQFTFPSTISLTLHNVVSLDKSYSNPTPESSPKSSPQKASFEPRLEQHPALRQTAPKVLGPPPRERRRGPICRFLAAIRRAFGSKTQHKLAH